MTKLFTLLLTVTSVTFLGARVLSAEVADRPSSHPARPPVPDAAKVYDSLRHLLAQTEPAENNEDLEKGLADFDWELPNQNPQRQFSYSLGLPIQLISPNSESEDGIQLNVDLTRLEKLETTPVETETEE
ncbi:hypothetical protein JJD41_02890 [Oxynema sp. CENA135]|uniref:hypothetical protein n=1 Tax=Oxynema sp. CENA135 TaxID=984206 RepID=UPI00190E2BC8|nr:hypothetical protein [Oxynema sp. CENA135]MBK4728837.1 hypothetical protein [Oxynema sp. CENA135]